MYTQANLKSSPKHALRNGLMASCIAALGFAAQARAGDTIQTFDPPGSLSTWATGINDKGAVTGYYDQLIGGIGGQRGYVRTADGKFTTFAPADPSVTFAESIDENGAVAGFFTDVSTHTRRGFLRAPAASSHNDGITVFDALYPPLPGTVSTYAWSISNGEIAGSYTLGDFVFHGFVRHADGTIERFDPKGSTSTWATSIKNGYVTGYYSDGTNTHCFMRLPNGLMEEFDPPVSINARCTAIDSGQWITGYYTHPDGSGPVGFVRSPLPAGKFTLFGGPAGNTYALSINDKKAVAGYWNDGDGASRGLVRAPAGNTKTFGPAKATDTYATSINRAGTIAGYWEDGQGEQHGFVRLTVKPAQN